MISPSNATDKVIAFQGWPGANSDMACRVVHPEMVTLACTSFEDVIRAVHDGRADLAMIPVENSVAGRVADVHRLLPDSGLVVTGEYFHEVHHHLLAVKGSDGAGIKRAHSHIQALGQCARRLMRMGIEPVVAADTAGAAKTVAEWGEPVEAAIATELAAEIYGLDIVARDIEDFEHNVTRFLIMGKGVKPASRNKRSVDPEPFLTTFVFEVNSRPAALYKALGGFATAGVNMTKLESYLTGPNFEQAVFYADVEGHIEDEALRQAMEELRFFTKQDTLKVLGTYPASPYRRDH